MLYQSIYLIYMFIFVCVCRILYIGGSRLYLNSNMRWRFCPTGRYTALNWFIVSNIEVICYYKYEKYITIYLSALIISDQAFVYRINSFF